MASIVEIWNLAAAHVGAKNAIESEIESSTIAGQCRLFWDPVRDAVLRDAPWSFATRSQALALSGTAPTGWEYSYSYPTDCLFVRHIVTASRYNADPVPFKIYRDGSDQYICTDQADAEIEYTVRVEDPNQYDAAFIETVALYLGSKLAMPVTRKPELGIELLGQYQAALSRAVALSRNEGQRDPERDPEIIRARS